MNYFEYFSEVEERFSARRGSLLLLSTLDWALIETWREAGVPLRAVLRGIDDAFDRYEARKARAKGRLAKVNGLAWCAQAVMEAATALAEASVGAPQEPAEGRATGFEQHRIASFLTGNAERLVGALAVSGDEQVSQALKSTAARLRELAQDVSAGKHASVEELDRNLSVLEERLQAALLTHLPEADIVAVRGAAEAELAPYRSRLGAVQLRQVREQFVQRRLWQQHNLPRLSLFYMPVQDNAEPSETGQGRTS